MEKEEIFNAPILKKLSPISGEYVMKYIFQNAGFKEHSIHGLAMNFIRLVDQAIKSYNRGRESMIEFTETNDQIAWNKAFDSCTQFEICVQSIHRAVLFLKSIDESKDKYQGLDLCFTSNDIKYITNMIKPIKKFRNKSQHLEEELSVGKIKKGQAISLKPCQNSLELGKWSVTYNLLTDSITFLHPIAVAVSKYREES